MNYFSAYIQKEHVGDVKRALLPAIHELQASIFANNRPGHESEDCRWERYITLRDLYLCLEGAEKRESDISVTPFKSTTEGSVIMHREAAFDFPVADDEKEDK